MHSLTGFYASWYHILAAACLCSNKERVKKKKGGGTELWDARAQLGGQFLKGKTHPNRNKPPPVFVRIAAHVPDADPSEHVVTAPEAATVQFTLVPYFLFFYFYYFLLLTIWSRGLIGMIGLGSLINYFFFCCQASFARGLQNFRIR